MTDSLASMMSKSSVENAWACSKRDVIKCSYNYVIPDLSLLTQKVGEFVTSPIFSSKSNEAIRWRLKIYPTGVNTESKDHLSVYLQRVMGDAAEKDSLTVVSSFTCSIFKNDKQIVSKSFDRQAFDLKSQTWGWEKCVSIRL